jgi:hypothetical protein
MHHTNPTQGEKKPLLPLCTHLYLHTPILAHTYTCIHLYLHTHILAHTYTCTHLYLHTLILAHTYTCTHTHTPVQVWACSKVHTLWRFHGQQGDKLTLSDVKDLLVYADAKPLASRGKDRSNMRDEKGANPSLLRYQGKIRGGVDANGFARMPTPVWEPFLANLAHAGKYFSQDPPPAPQELTLEDATIISVIERMGEMVFNERNKQDWGSAPATRSPYLAIRIFGWFLLQYEGCYVDTVRGKETAMAAMKDHLFFVLKYKGLAIFTMPARRGQNDRGAPVSVVKLVTTFPKGKWLEDLVVHKTVQPLVGMMEGGPAQYPGENHASLEEVVNRQEGQVMFLNIAFKVMEQWVFRFIERGHPKYNMVEIMVTNPTIFLDSDDDYHGPEEGRHGDGPGAYEHVGDDNDA